MVEIWPVSFLGTPLGEKNAWQRLFPLSIEDPSLAYHSHQVSILILKETHDHFIS